MAALFATPLGALLIFGLRVVDVSMATLRMIFSVRGYRWLAAGIGFVEVLIWVIAAGHTLQHLTSIPHLIAYAAGFGVGSFVGVQIESRLALGLQVVRAVCQSAPEADGTLPAQEAVRALRRAGYAATEVAGHGRDSRVDIINVVARRKKVPDVIAIVQEHDPDVFVTVEDVRTTAGGHLKPGGRKAPVVLNA